MYIKDTAPLYLFVLRAYPCYIFYNTLVKMQIILYEGKHFQGGFYECGKDCPNLKLYISQCNSVRVIKGCWMLYERTNYKGYQYFLKRGEYSNFHEWMGFNDSIRSCIAFPQYSGSFRLRLYERNNFGGKMLEAMDDCPSVSDCFDHHDIQSCNVFDGYWIFYELPHYKGRQYCLRPGEYRRFTDWGAPNARVGSFKKITEF